MMNSIKIVKRIARRLTTSTQHPFPFLLWVEYCLMGLNLLKFGHNLFIERSLELSPLSDFYPLATAALLFVFAGFGVFIPHQQTMGRKIAYTLAEFGLISLILLASAAYWEPSLLLIIVVIRSSMLFKLPGRFVTVGLALAPSLFTVFIFNFVIVPAMTEAKISFIPDLSEWIIFTFTETKLYSLLIQEILGDTLYLGLLLIFVLLLINALAAERQWRQRLAIAHDQLRQYALRIENQATLEERNRIAREIHDSLGHLLTAQKIQLNNALAFLPKDAASNKGRSFINEAKQLGVEALQELRHSLKMLRSDPLKAHSLEQLLKQLIARFNRDMELQIDHQLQLDAPISDEVKRAVFRIVEEALHNIYKHSGARQITLQVGVRQINPGAKAAYLEETAMLAYELWLIITDDGQGFEMSQNTSGFGLRGMQERALALGGELSINSQPGEGCQISGRLPLMGELSERTQ